MLTDMQESNLASGGDCHEHWHSSDRQMTQDSLHQLAQVESVRPVSGTVVVKPSDDLLLVNTTAASVTLPLPPAKNGRVLEIVKTAAANRVIITTSGADLILGASTVFIYNLGTALRLKAVTGGWIFA